MTNSSGRFLKGLMLGGSLIGLGYYLSKNKQFTEQVSTKYKDMVNVLSENSHGVQDKVMCMVKDTKTSLGESLDKTSKQFNDTLTRLTEAYHAGLDAAKTSLHSSGSETNFKESGVTNPGIIKDSGESPLGATEDTSTDNTSTLHPGSNNIAKSVGDAGTNFDKTVSGKTGSDRFGSDKFTGI